VVSLSSVFCVTTMRTSRSVNAVFLDLVILILLIDEYKLCNFRNNEEILK
jgi:hypothetical protein